MKHSIDRILTTHVGRLQRPDDLTDMMIARQAGKAYDPALFSSRLKTSVAEVVKRQADAGITVVNDGEFGRVSWLIYSFQRLSGFESKPIKPEQNSTVLHGKDRSDFADYYEHVSAEGGRTYYRSPGSFGAVGGIEGERWECTGPITYVGQAAIQDELKSLKAAMATTQVDEAFITATAPGDIAAVAPNNYYAREDDYLQALGDAMREEYRAITDAGIVLQIDDPFLPVQWDLMLAGNVTLAEYYRHCEKRIEVLNHALAGIPENMIRYHICWGSHHGPHSTDIPLKDVMPLLFKVRVSALMFEAANARHEHEWQTWKEVKLPEDKILIPGVISHATNTVEHPDLVAWRIRLFAETVGRERVIAGTDCGLGYRVHPQIAWAKLEALGEGARRSTKELFAPSRARS